jgi:hypothetical protein
VSASRIVEVNPNTNLIEWEYIAPDAPNFYSCICGGTERLPNGNTLICDSTKGRIFEVTLDKEVVWDYTHPFIKIRPDYWGWTTSRLVFTAHRYGTDFEGFKGKILTPDRFEWVVRKKSEKTIEEEKVISRLERLGY